MSVESTAFAEPTTPQRRLLRALAKRWLGAPFDWVDSVKVRPMNDGGMGSLELLVPGAPKERVFGSRVAELEFKDADEVLVIASLNVDQAMLPFELDVWKTDFGPLIGIPDNLEERPHGE